VGRANQLAPRLACRGDLELVLIRPDFEVHDHFTIDPSRIRINLAYGYMRAFDEFFRRENSGNNQLAPDSTPDACHLSTELIVRLRRAIWELEEQVLRDMLVRRGPDRTEASPRDPAIILDVSYFTADELSLLRALKRDL
jgi:hypothetical protein